MGYSSTVRASFTYDAIQALSPFNIESDLYQFFCEIGKENKDGSMTGTVYELIGESFKDSQGYSRRKCIRKGNFKIDSNGSVIRFPGLAKRLFSIVEFASNKRYNNEFGRLCA